MYFCRNCGSSYQTDDAVICVKCGCPKGQGNNFCPNCGKPVPQTSTVCLNCGVSLMPDANTNPNAKSKMAAGLLGIFLGSFGVHNFYLGYPAGMHDRRHPSFLFRYRRTDRIRYQYLGTRGRNHDPLRFHQSGRSGQSFKGLSFQLFHFTKFFYCHRDRYDCCKAVCDRCSIHDPVYADKKRQYQCKRQQKYDLSRQ